MEGWLSVCVCYIVYTLSFVSLGKRSLAHAWLFTGLRVYSPTDESVAEISSAGSSNEHTKKQMTIKDRMDKFVIESTRIQPGMLTMTSLQSNEGIRLWTNLDNACICAFSCVFALTFRFCLGWFLAIKNPCCVDIKCWVGWWQRQQDAMLLLSLLALMTFHSVWTLGKLSSGIGLRYPPACYVAGALLGLSTLWIVNTPALLQTLDIPATLALEESSARILLWSRLMGIRISNEELVLKWLMSVGKLAYTVFCASLGFVLWDPLQETSRIVVYRWLRLWKQPEKTWKRFSFMVSMASLFFLPLLILLTYLISQRGQVPRLNVRTLAAWLFVWVLCSLVKDLLQSYMDQAIPEVAMVLCEPSPPISDRVMFPFRSRFQRLVKTGSLLVTFPLCIIALLTTGHLCNVNCDMYPVPYKGTTLDKGTKKTLHCWENAQVVRTANSATNATGLVSHISPTRANACNQTLQPKRKYKKKIGTGRELLASAKPVRKSLAQVLGGLQVLALMAREDQIARKVLEHRENMPEEADDDMCFLEDTGKSADDLVAALTAVILHPVLTSTVVFPIVDLTSFLLCILWMVAFFGGILKYRQRMLQLGSFANTIDAKKEQ